MQSKTYRPPIMGLLFLILFSVMFSSCAPSPAFPAGTKSHKRCVVLVGATWCGPCNAIKDKVTPELAKLGLKIAEADKRGDADIHLADFDRDRGLLAEWRITAEQIPMAVAFENGKQVDQRCGSLGVLDFLALLDRPDLKPQGQPPTNVIPSDPPPVVHTDDAQSIDTWDQLLQFIGTDTATLTIAIPNGRRLAIPDARAAVSIPATLSAKVKVVGDGLQIEFDKPLIHAEAVRLGLRLGTEIPSCNLTRDKFTARTSLGIPFAWELKSHPFGEPAEDSAK